MSGHTPGPWTARMVYSQLWEIDAGGGEPRIGHSRWHALAVVHGCDDEPEEGAEIAKANAVLIASAPVMRAQLDAVERVLGEYESMTGAGYRYIAGNIRAAIAKAKGETP